MTLEKKQIKKSINVLIIFGCFLSGIFYFTNSIQAISISPLKHTIILDSGAVQDVAFNVTNDTDVEKKYVMALDAFRVDPNTGRAIFGETDTALNWISFPFGNSFSLKPNQIKEVIATVTIPPNEIPNTHYIGVFAQESVLSESGTVQIGSRVGTLMFIVVGGEMVEQFGIDYVVPIDFVTTKLPQFDLQLNNSGTIETSYVGKITLTNVSGRVVFEKIFTNDIEKVYAGMKKKHTINVSDLSWRDIGPLRATALVEYGISKKMINATTMVWYMPVWTYGLIIFLLGSTWFFIRWMHTVNNRQL